MRRSSSTERARRINAALALLRQHGSAAKAAAAMASRYGMSRRQAYRYVHQAEVIGREVSIPGKKIAFTVKLSQNLVEALRQCAKSTGQSLSDIVTEALEMFLYKGRGCG
ncbi:MAG: ribbon-helix-helix protein, CopG family [Promethearchaeota archaeon]